MEYQGNLLSKTLVLGIIILFIGVAVQPSIATDSKTPYDSSTIISENKNSNNSQDTTKIKIYKPNKIKTETLNMTKSEIFKKIEETENKILIVDRTIGSRHVKYWEHVIDDIYVKNDFILLHMNIENDDILKYERSWTDTDIILSDSKDLVFEPYNYSWKKKVFFEDEEDCKYFYTFYDSQVYPKACWEFRFKDGQTVLYNFNGEQIGHGIPAPSNGFLLSGYGTSDWPDTWRFYRENAEYWYNRWCNSTVSISLPTPETISSYVRNSTVKFFYEMAHGGSYHFVADSNKSYYYAFNPIDNNAWSDMFCRLPMHFAFIGSCDGMTKTGFGTFSFAFRRGQKINTATVGFSGMGTCPGWEVAWEWQDYMFSMMDEGNPIKYSFDMASAQYPTIAPCVVFVGDTNLNIIRNRAVYHPSYLKLFERFPMLEVFLRAMNLLR